MHTCCMKQAMKMPRKDAFDMAVPVFHKLLIYQFTVKRIARLSRDAPPKKSADFLACHTINSYACHFCFLYVCVQNSLSSNAEVLVLGSVINVIHRRLYICKRKRKNRTTSV